MHLLDIRQYLKNILNRVVHKANSTRLESLNGTVENDIINILRDSGFPDNDMVKQGIMDVVDLVADYHEEGTALFPNVLLVSSEKFFQTLSCRRIKVESKRLVKEDFSRMIKNCAPLATNGWNIYTVLSNEGNVEFGLISTDITDLSLGLYEQTVDVEIAQAGAIYIRNVGNKVVEIKSTQHHFFVALNLKTKTAQEEPDLIKLSKAILPPNKVDNYRECRNYLVKTIQHALDMGHGNLIAVISDCRDDVEKIKDSFRGGVWLEKPIDILGLVDEARRFKDCETSVKLRSYTSIMQSMLNFDGITLFTNNGKVLGYHFIVNNNEVNQDEIEGGSRTRAFMAMCRIEVIRACFMKSQDGRTNFNKK